MAVKGHVSNTTTQSVLLTFHVTDDSSPLGFDAISTASNSTNVVLSSKGGGREALTINQSYNVKSLLARERSPIESELFTSMGQNPNFPLYLHMYVSNLNGGVLDVCLDYWLNMEFTSILSDVVADAA